MMIKNLTIAICTKDRFNILEKCLQHVHKAVISAALEGSCEVLIIDDAALSEHKKQVLKETCGDITLKYYKKSGSQQRGLYGSRRLAVQLADTSHILFVDDDCLLGQDYIKDLFCKFNEYDVVGISGVDYSNLKAPSPAIANLWKLFFLSSQIDNRYLSLTGFNNGHAFWPEATSDFHCDFVHGCNMAFRLDAIRDIPECPWLTGHSIAEDLVIAHTAGKMGKILIVPALQFNHLETPGGRDQGLKKIKKKLISHWNFGRLHNPHPLFPFLFAWSTMGILMNAGWNMYLTKTGRNKARKS